MISSDIQEIIFVAFNSAKNANMHAENLQTINSIYSPSPKGRKFMVKTLKKSGNIMSIRRVLGFTEIKI